MSISHLTIQNFKSINHTELQFGDFTVLIGANAAGKTNIVQALKFLKDLVKEDVDNALSLQGGLKYLTNSRIENKEPTLISIELTLPGIEFDIDSAPINGNVIGKIYTISYDFFIKRIASSIKHPSQEIIISDSVKAGTYWESYTFDFDPLTRKEHLTSAKQRINNSYQTNAPLQYIRSEFSYDSNVLEGENLRGVTHIHGENTHLYYGVYYTEDKLLMFADHLFGIHIQEKISDIGVYTFSSRAMKQESSIIGRKELEPDGSNLTLVLKRIMEDEQKRHQFLLLLEYALPFIKNVTVDAANGRSLVALLTEKYDESFALPSVFFSEGTISVIALIIVLFFEEKSVVVIEEPERYVHPSLLAKLVELMKDASRNKQVIITTHSPEIVKQAGVENLLLVQRDKEGFTTASRPEDSNDVKVFLQNEIGLDDLFIDNLLGV